MGIKNALFFKKSGCRARYEPKTPEKQKETTLAQAVSNFLFFDDLKTVASQESEATAATATPSEDDNAADENQEAKESNDSDDKMKKPKNKQAPATSTDAEDAGKVLGVDLEKTLFFTDVGCKAKYKPQKPKKPTNMMEAIGNIGADVHNMLFFDDLKTLNSQNASVAQSDDDASLRSTKSSNQKSRSVNANPYKAFLTYGDIDEMTMPFSDEDTVQVKSRKLTIPPPAMKRFKKIDYDRHMKLRP